MFGLGVSEVIVLSLLGLLLFGNKLPGLARSLGKSFTEFQRGLRGLKDDLCH